MKEFTADDFRQDPARVLREAQDEPVRVTEGGAEGVVISAARFEEYERLRRLDAWERLSKLMDEMGAYATAQGLTDEILADILADES